MVRGDQISNSTYPINLISLPATYGEVREVLNILVQHADKLVRDDVKSKVQFLLYTLLNNFGNVNVEQYSLRLLKGIAGIQIFQLSLNNINCNHVLACMISMVYRSAKS